MNTLPLTGTRDFLPQDVKLRRKIFDKLCVIAETHAFLPIETPSIERIETLQGKYGEEGEKLLYKILKRGEKAKLGECDSVLRYDLTVPSMRFYAEYKDLLPKIFKRYQFGPVWRADRPGKGRFREFYQFDFDIYGTNSYLADVECLNMLIDSLDALKVKNYRVRLNSRELLSALMDEFRIPFSNHKSILRELDKTDKIGNQALSDNLKSFGQIGQLFELADIFKNQDYNEILLNRLSKNQNYFEIVNTLNNIINLSNKNKSQTNIFIDLTLARGLDYYTGPIYEIEVEGVKGSIAAGGRYNSLSTLFMKEEVPVCGSSLGIERLIPLIDPIIFESDTSVKINIASYKSDYEFLCVTSSELREIGCNVEMQYESYLSINKALSNASKSNSDYIIYKGENEDLLGTVIIKDMKNKLQNDIPIKNIINYFKNILS